MNSCFNGTSDAGNKTFEWIFNNAEQPHAVSSYLASWLESRELIFPVQGKARSGKSTFMKFVFERLTTKVLLQQGTDQKSVMSLSSRDAASFVCFRTFAAIMIHLTEGLHQRLAASPTRDLPPPQATAFA